MALPLLVTPDDAADLGFELSEKVLARASRRVRTYTGFTLTRAEHTTTAKGPIFRLPERPFHRVLAVTAEETGEPFAWDAGPAGVVHVHTINRVIVDYEAGFDPVPETLAEIVCTIAERLAGQKNDDALAAGVQTQSFGQQSASYGWDAWKARSSLTAEEKSQLDKMFPSYPGLTVMRP